MTVTKEGKDSRSTIAPPSFKKWGEVQRELGLRLLKNTDPRKETRLGMADALYVNADIDSTLLDVNLSLAANYAMLANLLGKDKDFLKIAEDLRKSVPKDLLRPDQEMVSLLSGALSIATAQDRTINYNISKVPQFNSDVSTVAAVAIGAFALHKFGFNGQDKVIDELYELTGYHEPRGLPPALDVVEWRFLRGILAFMQGDNDTTEKVLEEIETKFAKLLTDMLPPVPYSTRIRQHAILAGIFLALLSGKEPRILTP